MDYLPRITVRPSHERLQVPSLEGLVTASLSNSDGLLHPFSYPPGPAQDGVPEQKDTEIAMLCDLFSRTLNQFLAITGSELTLLLPAPTETFDDQTYGVKEFPIGSLSLVLTRLVKQHFKGGSGGSSGNSVQNKQAVELLQRTTIHLEKYRDALTKSPSTVQSGTSGVPLSDLAILSLQCLVETLYDLTLPQIRLTAVYSIANPYPFWMENALVDKLLYDSGWDESKTSSLPRDIRFRYYLSFLATGAPDLKRRRSSAHFKERYSPIHVSRHCNCDRLSVDLNTVDTAIASPYFNLVTFSPIGGHHHGGLKLKKQKLPSEKDASLVFVAFSHLRSDGLGSSEENALPRCQVEYLQGLSNQLLPEEKHPVPFYIDTLCVPIRGPAKASALRNMQPVFENARKVLGLDIGLSATAVSSFAQENLTRIRYSSFMQRLYTVAECTVSPDMYFRFQGDSLVSLKDLTSTFDMNEELPLLSTVSFKDRRRNTLTPEDFDDLSLALTWLSDDLHVLKMYSKGQLDKSLAKVSINAAFPSVSDEWSASREVDGVYFLRRLLRLGFLALPQMRYFAQANEAATLDEIANKTLEAYRVPLNESGSPKTRLLPSYLRECSDINHVLERLGTLYKLTSSLRL
ncbi:uncharacterized protein Z520_03664 [Fonsecaea multimorphosa CBS 102226]|uniref:Heterokaryon incompatibility domain-containing protein n=1 Tax=Fonsecaea multimorphosa CBS 102226 TaxID=1442371 RepID=A0A0D2K5D1_9EURO|nr:uncharacterized protein Z520_03664 [Fonsecaea multimorphosa CBS 102226]KIY00998.1 hypothetical protein Z520_03664 [Fonsecaea multimorphosa CBS 102226]OAL27583.1 hypothetical protein AYO22_03487 [Fonsecaea multimorphosa]